MKSRISAFILCACLLIVTLTGCNIKLAPDTGASPEASDNTAADPSGGMVLNVDANLSTLLGVVTNVTYGSITLALVLPYDTPAGYDADTVLDIVTSGSAAYTVTRETQLVTIDNSTLVILEYEGYTPGLIGDIAVGDFLAVTRTDSTAVLVIDNGEANLVSSSIELGTTPSTDGYDDTEPVQPSPSGTLNPSPDTTPAAGKTYVVVNTDQLKARSGPGTSYVILGQLASGTELTGTITNGWLKFDYNGQTAYCSADYLEAVS